MYFKLSVTQESELLNLPETGMGYQVIEAGRTGRYQKERFLVLNSEIIFEFNGMEKEYLNLVLKSGISFIKTNATQITLNNINVLNEKQFRGLLNESKNDITGALDNPIELANGEEVFIRLSAFEDDKRVDKERKCLRPGSYTTTNEDYLNCKNKNDDPIERYALPNNDEIKHAFYIQPFKSDTLQRGIVQPANGKTGGGKEAYFADGTSYSTFIQRTDY